MQEQDARYRKENRGQNTGDWN